MSTEQERDKLLPCPFCGGEPCTYTDLNTRVVFVYCRKCNARSTGAGGGIEAYDTVTKHWNRRSSMKKQDDKEDNILRAIFLAANYKMRALEKQNRELQKLSDEYLDLLCHISSGGDAVEHLSKLSTYGWKL